MSRGRKPTSYLPSNNWEDIFWNSLPTYIGILNIYFTNNNYEFVAIGDCLKKLSFTIPKGLNSKEIHSSGKHPVISQSKEYIIGFSERTDLLVDKDLPLIIFGDHSKTIKYVDEPFIIGADGVKLVKPISSFNERFFYYFIFGIITDTKDYGRHFSLLRNGLIAKVEDLELQIKVVEFLDTLKSNAFSNKNVFFNASVENEIYHLQKNQLKGNAISTELTNQINLVKKLRQQLLQDAVQGKLVEQNKKDEPASELLNKIKKQKDTLIKQKKLKIGRETEQSVSLINDVEIPNSWQWCKSDEIFFVTKLAGFEYSEHISLKESGEIPVIRAQNVRPLNIDKTNLLYIDAKTSATLERCALIKKCLLVTFIGAGIGDVATFEETERWHLAPNVAKMEPFEGCEELTNVKYLNYYLMSRLGQKEIFKHVKATAQPSLSMGTIRDIDFAIPPLAEQNRIVQKLDELMQYCNELEASIKQSESQNEKLLQQVLREALRKEPVEA